MATDVAYRMRLKSTVQPTSWSEVFYLSTGDFDESQTATDNQALKICAARLLLAAADVVQDYVTRQPITTPPTRPVKIAGNSTANSTLVGQPEFVAAMVTFGGEGVSRHWRLPGIPQSWTSLNSYTGPGPTTGAMKQFCNAVNNSVYCRSFDDTQPLIPIASINAATSLITTTVAHGITVTNNPATYVRFSRVRDINGHAKSGTYKVIQMATPVANELQLYGTPIGVNVGQVGFLRLYSPLFVQFDVTPVVDTNVHRRATGKLPNQFVGRRSHPARLVP
jgi:hypothetical protein